MFSTEEYFLDERDIIQLSQINHIHSMPVFTHWAEDMLGSAGLIQFGKQLFLCSGVWGANRTCPLRNTVNFIVTVDYVIGCSFLIRH